MLAALTPLPIDLFSEWSVNTEEQTSNGTINERLDRRTTPCQEHVCVRALNCEEAQGYVCMIGRCLVSPLCCA